MQSLVADNLALAAEVARRVCRANPTLDVEDLTQEGFIGLHAAAERWDESRGVPFSAYARFVILGHIRDYLRSQDWRYRRAHRVREHPIEEGQIPAVHPALADHFLLSRLKMALDRLPAREHAMLRMYFFEGLSWSEIAEVWGVSPRVVSRWQKAAIEQLRRDLTDDGGGKDAGPDLPLAA